MTSFTTEAPPPPRRTFWEPWVAGAIAALLYLRVAGGQWGGLAALAAELALAVVLRARFLRRADEEVELMERLLSRDLPAADVDRMIGGTTERVQGMFATASSALLATGMAASAFLLLFYASSGAGIISVAPKAFVATGYAILCALALTRDAHYFAATVIEPLRRQRLEDSRDTAIEAAAITALTADESSAQRLEQLIEQLVAMQIGHLQELNETNRLLAAAASERVDEESGAVRVKLAKGLTDFRKSVEQLNTIVQSLNTRLDGLTNEESALFEQHRRELVGEVSRLPQQVTDRAAGLIASSVGQVEDRLRQALQTIHDDENRRARDLLAGEFNVLRDQFELAGRSVSAITLQFNGVVSSLDALASAFDRSAKSVVGSAAEFTAQAESRVKSRTGAVGEL
jgi:hypothetical protein